MNQCKRGNLLKFSIMFILVCIIFLNQTNAFADTQYEDEANKLKILGIFKGSDKGFELERAPNRVEGAVMLIRLLGKEKEVKEGDFIHPFTDVPSWADSYIGYMYENGLTEGIGNNQFGSQKLVNANTYTTFILRALGYDDSKGDFSWDKAVSKGVEVGIIESGLQEYYISPQFYFLRDNLVHLSYASLEVNLKGKAISLGNKLVAEKVFSLDKGKEVGLKLNGLNNKLEDSSDEVTLSFTKVETDFWIPQHILKVNRDRLPEAIKDFKYVFSSGNNKPTNDILEYIMHRTILQDVDSDIERIDRKRGSYDNQEGIPMGSYDFNILTFYSKDEQLLGYVFFDGVLDGEVTTNLYTYSSINELEKPKGYDELIQKYVKLPTIEDEFSILNLDGSSYLTINKEELPAKLSHAYAINFGSTSDDRYEEEYFIYDYFNGKLTNGSIIGDEVISLGTYINSGHNAIIKLYDKEYHVIAVSIIKPRQFKKSDPNYVYFSGKVYNDSRIDESDFKIERYINGELDTNFDNQVSFGTEYYDSDKPATFKCGPLYTGSDDVEYRFKSLNEDLTNVILKHY